MLEELHEALLAAVAGTGDWAPVTAALAALLEVSGVVMASTGQEGEAATVIAVAGLDREVVAAVLARDPRLVRVAAAGLPAAPALDALGSDDPWRTLREQLGAVREAGCALHLPGLPPVLLWLVREPDQPLFDAADRDRLGRLLPPLTCALTARARIRRVEAESSLVREAFHLVTAGMLLVRPDGTVAFANRAAERILERDDGLRLADGRLEARSRQVNGRLREAMTGDGGDGRPVAVTVSRPSGAPDLELLVARLAPGGGPFPAAAGSLVFVVDPEGGAPGVEDHIRALYGLTPAEARLAVLLLAGRSLSGAARRLGVSRNTAHTQLASVFAKTGTSSQNELIRRLLRGPAGIHRAPSGRYRAFDPGE